MKSNVICELIAEIRLEILSIQYFDTLELSFQLKDIFKELQKFLFCIFL